MGDLTANFNLKDFITSTEAPELLVDFKFNEAQTWRVFLLCVTILQPARNYVGRAIIVTNGIRTPALRDALKKNHKPVANSDHDFDEPDNAAADITCGNPDEPAIAAANETLFQFIRNRLPHTFGQLIAYRNAQGKIKHLHVSLPRPGNVGEVYESRHGETRLTPLPQTTL